jgi:hypothetical protein
MAIRIPIITVFDSKGLKAAQYQLNKVRGNFQNLGRNAAIAGAAVAAFGAVIATSAKALSRIETINAQTNAVLKSMGTTANGTAKDIENLAGRLEALTATEAETIQEGANLLLTFKNIQNQAGAGNDIFDQTAVAMVDLARAMGTTASGEAIRLGKALNDPVRGMAALTRVGIQFTEEQRNQIKVLQESGDIMGAQKIILAELQAQFGGSGAAYAATFAGQLELLNHELGALGEEAALVVMPALQELVRAFREIAPEAGEKLKAAIGAVDWAAFAKVVADTVIFFVQNAEAILKTVAAIFLLNTAYNTLKVTVGIANAVIAFTNVLLGGTTTAATVATGALNLFKGALMLTGIGAVIVALGLIVQGITEADSAYRKTTPVVTSFGTAVLNSGKDAEWAAGKYGVLKAGLEALPKNVKINVALETTARNNELQRYLDFLGVRGGQASPVELEKITTGSLNGGGSGNTRLSRSDFMSQLSSDQMRMVNENNAVSRAVVALGETTIKKSKAVAAAVRAEFAASRVAAVVQEQIIEQTEELQEVQDSALQAAEEAAQK